MYVPLGNQAIESRMEVLLMKFLKGSKRQKIYVKEIKASILVLTHKVESHAIAIKELDYLFGQMSTALIQCQSGTYLSITISNPNKDGHWLLITT